MKKLFFLVFCYLSLASNVSAGSIIFSRPQVTQGEPLLITLVASSTPQTVTLEGKRLNIFSYAGAYHSLLGINLNKKIGDYVVSVVWSDGVVATGTFTVLPRLRYEAPLGIPDKLGGNTVQAGVSLVSTLAKENATLLNLRTGRHAFWTEAFRPPLATTTVTDTYGYSRQTGGQSITHKGTDYRATLGTPVYAMNRGVVRLTKTYTVYGKTIILDHGLGVQTLYMHLSKILVNPGELVLPGQVIGWSGDTGYAETPHLHLSVRIGEISIDPEVFLGLFENGL